MKKVEKNSDKGFGRRNLRAKRVENEFTGLSAPGQAWKEGICGDALKLFIGTRQVTNPARPSVPAAGTECCVALGQPMLRSVHRESVGRAIELRKDIVEADVFQPAEGIILPSDRQSWQDSTGV